MTMFVKKGDEQFQDWFYSQGCSNQVAKTREDFKQEVIDFCIGSRLMEQKKFKEELCKQYDTRLSEWAEEKGYCPKKVWHKTRSERIRNKIRILFFTEGNELIKLAKRLKEWKNLKKSKL